MSVTYYVGSGQAAFTAVATIGLPVWEKPFDDVNSKLVFRQRFMQAAANWTPTALNVTYPAHGSYGVPTSSSYYLVSEENFADERAGLLTWDRVYAAVPAARTEYTAIAFQYPAVLTIPVVTGSYQNFTSFGYAGVDRVYIDASSSISFSRGDMAAVSYRVAISGTTTQINNLVEVREIGLSGGIIADLPPNFFDATITVTRQIARAIRTTGRAQAKTLVGRAAIDYSYVLITPAVTPVFTFNSRQAFTLDGQEVDYVNSKTVPSISTYAGYVSGGTFFYAEDDTWARWLGNIYEKRSVRVVAL